ncbi:MAG: NAD(P)-binding domain-containing protein [Pseudomonadota bacterium]
MSRVGFIGRGIMGAPVARHLIAGGHALFLYNRRGPCHLIAARGFAGATPYRLPNEPRRSFSWRLTHGT